MQMGGLGASADDPRNFESRIPQVETWGNMVKHGDEVDKGSARGAGKSDPTCRREDSVVKHEVWKQ